MRHGAGSRMLHKALMALMGISALWPVWVPPPVAAAVPAQTNSAPASDTSSIRIVTLAPHITELVFAAGAGDKIVATVLSSDYPPAARDIPRVGNGLEVSVERILAFQPSAVITWQPQGVAQALSPALSRLNIPLLLSRPGRLRDIPEEIIRYGQLFNTQDQANAAAQALTQRLDTLARQYAQRTPVTVFIEVGTSPLYTIGADPLLNDALRLCGGINIYANSSVAAPQVSVESILVQRPDVVITPARNRAAQDEARQRWTALQLPAAVNGHVYMIDPDTLFRPGPRLVDATEALCRALDQAR
ncbi:cobalamin-binding protein [Pollutimonas harenae]|uniref:Cobalamin-binding protein n=1 Tax=Pollutimonas harenae TaxID=657015 RepID=A0A853GTT8_9BURK|nr:cobalamin-binding protein [Pollutimonas harenae]NYT84196.1 cobalamin-binding protein [Pollutimonas harenae]TEA73388.1 cobalamin-binding protein [Pollutimonas harenae]